MLVLFCTVWTFFINNLSVDPKNFDVIYSITVFNSAPPECISLLHPKTAFWYRYIVGPKMSCIDDKLILFFATDLKDRALLF